MGIAAPKIKLAVAGATGSIGQQTLDIVRSFPQHFQVIALSGSRNISLLQHQIDEFKPEYVGYQGENLDLPRCERLSVEEIASLPEADIIVMGIGGTAGLLPTLSAVKAGKKIALANKESLVAAGGIITHEALKNGAKLYPVDSEHSAIWQCLQGENKIGRIILTASGGPFFKYNERRLAKVSADQALNHPSWKMGKKITIDSATLMNKGLEVIEARWLFNVPLSHIDIVIHPQSIIHSMVEFVDGTVKAQLSNPDMRLPILYAISYPERLSFHGVPRINWQELKELDFGRPDMARFPCLKLAIEAGGKGGTYPAALCGADETAVELFLKGKIKFTDIPVLVEKALEQHESVENPGIEDIMNAVAEGMRLADVSRK